jgi:hypothetical protein
MTNQRLPAIVDYSNPVHHRAGAQFAAEAGSLTFLATWGLNRPEPGLPTEVLAKHYVAIGVSVPEVVPDATGNLSGRI